MHLTLLTVAAEYVGEEVVVEVALVLDYVEDFLLGRAFSFFSAAESDHRIGDFVVLVEGVPERQHQSTKEPNHQNESSQPSRSHRESQEQISLSDALVL